MVVGHEKRVGHLDIDRGAPARSLPLEPLARSQQGGVAVCNVAIGPGPPIAPDEDGQHHHATHQRRTAPTVEPAPKLGQHTDDVFASWLNLSGGDIAKLKAEKVIGN